MQCIGRLVLKENLYFESAPTANRNKPLLFFIPTRCNSDCDEGLCDKCIIKNESTQMSLEKRSGKYIPNQQSLLHGTVNEPIPEWSRLYMGAWWQKQFDSGYTMSYETERSAENAHRHTHKDVDINLSSITMAPRKNTKALTEIPVASSDDTESPAAPTKRVMKKKVVVKEEAPVPPIEPPVAPTKRVMKKKVVVKEEAPVPPVEPPVAPTKKIMKKKAVVKEEAPAPLETPVPPVEPPPKKIMKKKAVVKEEAPAPLETPVSVEPPPKKIMKKKAVVKEEAPVPLETPTPSNEVVKEEKFETFKPSKKVKNPPAEPMIQIINQTPIDTDEEIVIVLSKIEIGTKKFLYNSSNDKLYDLKYKYIGRRKGCEIDTSFPDSDGE